MKTIKATHTPGPWKASESKAEKGAWFVEYFDPEYNEYYGLWEEDGGVTYNEADARLIAAAPDLLEAIKRYKTWVDRSEAEKVLAVVEAEHQLVERELNEAIAKAEGR